MHPTAIISATAQLGKGVRIGPYTVIDGHVILGDNCRVGPHVHLSGHTTIGEETVIHAGAIVGDTPQDLAYDSKSVTHTEIGRKCTIREYATIHRGSAPGSKTVVGDRSMLMGFVHLGHNCRIGSDVVIANLTVLAGHVEVEDRAFLSASVGVHQFVRIGTMAMIGAHNLILQDVPPYCLLQEGGVCGMNHVGLRRGGINQKTRLAVRGAIKVYFFSGLNRPNALATITERYRGIPEVSHFVAFVQSTKRGIIDARRRSQAETEPAPEPDDDDSATGS
ncbi:MAG: acyl-[acyl-carrier-protein]--UDP-N-acetylglucosamine O-acyltransferase [Lentisphaerae bacterium RIFOXYB12_FULL_65_16]|nr:MAG: acyl-[acyl-carrier-protein]--UDP-N-acetylglucosamine O-acyltransferase [Lentisphaerae bacterium RIFOXYA12_64_32]OGV89785.1 MAG: acyl-[acyl-carrier-protein]--UDP-N-acetylglucosamine O-acyltransferase [Lentisphaerae bacterium RIFOXYB12_FULL_65_16]